MPVEDGSYPVPGDLFSGEIDISLEVRNADGTSVGVLDTVRLRVAPWLMLGRHQDSEEVWVGDGAHLNEDFRNEPLNGHYAGLQDSGQMQTATQLVSHWWTQDHVEIGYTQRPGQPPSYLVFRLPYDQGFGLPPWPETKLFGPDVGLFVHPFLNGWTGDIGGNVELLAPDPVSPPTELHGLGIAMFGDAASSNLQNFIVAQEFQHSPLSFSVESDWLIVKHIDEFLSFLSDNRVLNRQRPPGHRTAGGQLHHRGGARLPRLLRERRNHLRRHGHGGHPADRRPCDLRR